MKLKVGYYLQFPIVVGIITHMNLSSNLKLYKAKIEDTKRTEKAENAAITLLGT